MEWAVVTVLGALVGLFATVGAPIIKLITSLTKLTSEVTHLRESMSESSERNDASHKEICEHIEAQGKTLEDHEKRIFVMEIEKNKKEVD